MGDLAAIEDTSLADWSRTIGVDQTGVFLGMKMAAPALATPGHRSVINISSIFGTSGGFLVTELTRPVAARWRQSGQILGRRPGRCGQTSISTPGLSCGRAARCTRGAGLLDAGCRRFEAGLKNLSPFTSRSGAGTAGRGRPARSGRSDPC